MSTAATFMRLHSRPGRRSARLSPISVNSSMRAAGIVQEEPVELAGRRPGAGLPHAAVAHAEVLALQDHRDALRLEVRLDRVRDLLGQLLLHLQALGEDVHHARELAQADDAPVGNVRHVRLADERHHVVLAVAVHLDVAHEHQLVVALDLLEGLGQVLGRVHVRSRRSARSSRAPRAPASRAGPRASGPRRESAECRARAPRYVPRLWRYGSGQGSLQACVHGGVGS